MRECVICWALDRLVRYGEFMRHYWQRHLCTLGLGHAKDHHAYRCAECGLDWRSIESGWGLCFEWTDPPRIGHTIVVKLPRVTNTNA